MAKKKPKYMVLNDYNEIVAHFKKKSEDERNIVISILGASLGIALVVLYLVMKG